MAPKKQKPEVTDDEDLLGDEQPTAGMGHNRPPKVALPNGNSADQLLSIIERVERLTEEKQALQGDISDVFREAKANGYDVNTIRKIIKLRKMDKHERDEEEYLLDTYKLALGMVADYDV